MKVNFTPIAAVPSLSLTASARTDAGIVSNAKNGGKPRCFLFILAALVVAVAEPRPMRQMPYQPASDLMLTFSEADEVSNDRREPDLDTAVATTTYTSGGGPWAVTHRREVFASAVDQVVVVRVSAAQPGRPRSDGQVAFSLGMLSPQHAVSRAEGNETSSF